MKIFVNRQDEQDGQDSENKGRNSPILILHRVNPVHPVSSLFSIFALLAFFAAMSCLSSSAQIQQAWVAKYNNGITNGSHQAVKMALDTNGNIYITGFSQTANSNLGYATIKYAPNGNQAWAARFDSTNTTTAQPAGLVLDPQGNVIVTGSAVTVKWDTNGNQLWTAPYCGNSLAVDTNGNVCVTGFNTNFNTVKLSPQGSNLWLTTYMATVGPNIGEVVAIDGGGNVYVSGFSSFLSGTRSSNEELTTIKYDENGKQLWAASWLCGFEPYGLQVAGYALDGGGNFYIVENYALAVRVSYLTLKFASSDGTVVFAAGNPTGDLYSLGYGLALDGSNNVFVTGRNSYYYPNSSFGTYKINTDGAYIWTNNYPLIPTTLNVGTAIVVGPGNNVYVTGYSQDSTSGLDIVTIKYDNNGNQIWLQRYNGPGNGDDEGNAIAVDASGNVYVTGYETVAGGGTEMVTIKYAPGPSIQKQSNGNVLLQTAGSPGQGFDFQGSTNLQTWQDLGTNTADSNGLAQFLDTNAPLFPYRFYLTNPH